MTFAADAVPNRGATRFSDIIYEKIVGMIADGNFPVNERLPSETKLAADFGASRPVVREALERLRADGLVVSRKGSGSYVRQRPDSSMLKMVPVGSLADVQRFFEFRAGLEAEAAELAARNWQPADKERITAALLSIEQCLRNGELGAEEDQVLHEANGDFGGAWLSANSAGSGPFSLAQWRPNDVAIFNAQPKYWGGKPAMRLPGENRFTSTGFCLPLG